VPRVSKIDNTFVEPRGVMSFQSRAKPHFGMGWKAYVFSRKKNMKKQTVSLLAAAGLLVGCNQSVQNASDKFNELPPAVQKTARAQDPNAEIVDVSDTTANGNKAYEIQFRGQNGNPKVVVAQDGTLITSDLPKTAGAIDKLLTPTGATGTPFSSLPLAAQKTIQKQAPDGRISGISRHEDNGRVTYEISFKDLGSMKVAEDGTLVQTLQK